ncbi:MAG: transcription antitermination protein NusB [Pseudomonadota bacterium]
MTISPRARRQARRALVQALYQWQLSRIDPVQLLAQFQEGESLKKADGEFFRELLSGVIRQVEGDVENAADPAAEASADDAADHADCAVTLNVLDDRFAAKLDRKLQELDQVELAILRLGAYELAERIDVPYRVVIDEYVNLAKLFGAEASHKYINGVLDAVARDCRAFETAQPAS